jgi:hypothetical protein
VKIYFNKALLLLVLSFQLLNTACTRLTSDGTKDSSVSFALPSASEIARLAKSSAFSKIKNKAGGSNTAMTSSPDLSTIHVAINVKSATNNIYCLYDSKRDTRIGPCNINYPNVDFELKSGEENLIQVIYAVDVGDNTMMMYGDAKTVISGSNASVNIALSSLGDFGPMGHINGRYINGTPGSPVYDTGLLEMKYVPTNGNPAMTIKQYEVIAGWFHGMVTTNINFVYQINGKTWFPDATSGMNISYLQGLAARSAPAGDDVRLTFENGSSSFYRTGGFFGPGVNSSTYYTVPTIASCSGNKYSTCLEVTGSGASDFIGPFIPSSNGKYVEVVSTDYRVNWINGADSTVIDGFRVFKIPNINKPDDLKPYFIDDGQWNCDEISRSVPTSPSPVNIARGAGTYTDTAISSLSPTATDVLVFCPIKNGKLFNSAVLFPDYLNNFDTGGFDGPYIYVDLEGAYLNNTGDGFELTRDQCYPVKAYSYKGNAEPNLVSGSPVIIDLAAGGTDDLFYTDSACQNDQAGSIAVTINGGSYMSFDNYYYKVTTDSATPFEIAVTTTNTDYFVSDVSSTVYTPTLQIMGPEKLAVGDCGRYEVWHTDHYGQWIEATAAIPVDLSVTAAGTPPDLFSDSICSVSASFSTSIPVNQSKGYFYAKINSANQATFNLPNNTNFDRFGTTTEIKADNLSALKLKMSVVEGDDLVLGQCYTAKFYLVDNSNVETISTVDYGFMPRSSQLSFYDGNDCDSIPAEFSMISSGASYKYLKFKPLISGSIVFDNTYGSDVELGGGSVTGGSPSIDTSSDEIFIGITGTLPNWKNRIVGSHEFGSTKTISFQASEGADVSCRKFDINWNNESSCVWNSGALQLTWSQADAIAGAKYKLKAETDSEYLEFNFDPNEVFGNEFKVLLCNATLSSGADLNALRTAINGNPIVCLNSAINISGSLGGGLYIQNNGGVIGWIGNNATDRATIDLSSAGGYYLSLASGSTDYKGKIANIKMIAPDTAIGTSSFSSSSSNNDALLDISNLYIESNCTTANYGALEFVGASVLDIKIRESYIKLNQSTSTAGCTGLYILNQTPTSSDGGLDFINTTFEAATTNVTTAANLPLFIKAVNTTIGPSMNIKLTKVAGLGEARFIETEGYSSSLNVDVWASMLNLNLSSSFSGSSHNADIITLKKFSSLVIEGSEITLNTNDSLFNLSQITDEPVYLSLFDNKIINKKATPLIYSAADTNTAFYQSSATTLNFVGNHFLRTTTGGSAEFFVHNIPSAVTIGSKYTQPGVSPITYPDIGQNRFCQDSGGAWTFTGTEVTFGGSPAMTSGVSGGKTCSLPNP